MDCKYHINQKALWHCEQCDTPFCMDCCDLEAGYVTPRCILCRNRLAGMDVSESIEPFWNKLTQFNRYPLQDNAKKFFLTFFIVSLLAGFIINAIPFFLVKIICQLAVLSFFVSYVFKALTKTARGNFEAPSYNEAIAFNSDKMTWQVILLSISLVLIAFAVEAIFSSMGLLIYLGLLVFSAPAILIVFAMSQNLSAALNPVEIMSTIRQIGLPYLILVGFVLVINFSTAYAEEFIASWLPESFSYALAYSVNLFFSMIMFHMLGYVVYQYHSELGYGVDIEVLAANQNVQMTAQLRLLAHADVYIQEGRFEDAQTALSEAAEHLDYREQALSKLVRLHIAKQDNLQVIKSAQQYFLDPQLKRYGEKALEIYYKVYQFEPRFKPMSANARAVLINLMRNKKQSDQVERLTDDLEDKLASDPALPQALLAKAKYYIEVLHQDMKGLEILQDLLKMQPQGEHKKEAEQLLKVVKNLTV